MTKLKPGLYEQLITQGLQAQLDELGGRLAVDRSGLHPEEAPDRIALYLGGLIKQAVAALNPKQRSALGVALAREVVSLLEAHPQSGIDSQDRLPDEAMVLRALLGYRPDGSPTSLPLPATPLLDTTLLTNAPGEPRVGHQLRTEIPSADRIDMLMAFVRQTGIRPLLDLLRRHRDEGRQLRLLTTTYTGSTEIAALEALRDAGAEIRVSYDTSSTRLHAKAWLFHRASGYSTAYIGSSNLTHSAQVSGLEWNLRVAGARNPDVIEKFTAVFDSYWNHGDFRPFDANEFRALTRTELSAGPRLLLSPIELRPEPFQSRLLELIALARLQGRHRNLLVAATGTGKTVMAALDYQRLRQQLPRARLLFVAHRKEILEQGIATFRHALRDAAFGEAWVGGDVPEGFEHVFASIQSLSGKRLRRLQPDHFDVVIIDEFHHAAAPTYTALLEHLAPRELLGLTATPERGDGASILHWFDGRIAAELRLWDAIEQQRLCPFAYYGISDGTDLSGIEWRRGTGYDVNQLDKVLSGNDVRARLVIAQTIEHVSDVGAMRALGFCVSVAHARFMARHFNAAGIAAVAVTGETSSNDRERAIGDLQSGSLRVVFTVDLFNEGIDIPATDTLLLLRPTDSATVFLQQLGRGLRRHPGKTVCTVLDFVSQHNQSFQIHRRYACLLGSSRRQLIEQVEQGFPFLPSGCHLQLDARAAADVLRNLRESLPYTLAARASELRRVAETLKRPSLAQFIEASGLPLEELYSGNHCWSSLLEASGLGTLPAGPEEKVLRRALGRLLHIDDGERIAAFRTWACTLAPLDPASLCLRERRLLHMLLATLLDQVGPIIDTLQSGLDLLRKHPQVMSEMVELLDVLEARIDHLLAPLHQRPDLPLQVHARYSRREILASMGHATTTTVPIWREGVRWFADERADAFLLTLDKSGERFSPTTRYRDYAVSPRLLHWESQSTTRADSETGRRYREHVERGSIVLLFARLRADERAFWFLGPARYLSHEGERPMAITWELEHTLPGDLFARFAAAVA